MNIPAVSVEEARTTFEMIASGEFFIKTVAAIDRATEKGERNFTTYYTNDGDMFIFPDSLSSIALKSIEKIEKEKNKVLRLNLSDISSDVYFNLTSRFPKLHEINIGKSETGTNPKLEHKSGMYQISGASAINKVL